MFSKMMNYITKKTGFRPETYAIFVWMRQVNDRLRDLEKNKTAGVIEQRVEIDAHVESVIDKIYGEMALLEKRVLDLEEAKNAM